MPDDAVEDILERVRERGGRVTTARRLVIATLLEARSHLGAEEITAIVQTGHPEVHLTTVYRTLESLEELGIVQHTHLGHGAAVYHLGALHQHLVCEECGEVTDVPATLLDDLAATLRERHGFDLHVGHFALLGRCARHAETEPPPADTEEVLNARARSARRGPAVPGADRNAG